MNTGSWLMSHIRITARLSYHSKLLRAAATLLSTSAPNKFNTRRHLPPVLTNTRHKIEKWHFINIHKLSDTHEHHYEYLHMPLNSSMAAETSTRKSAVCAGNNAVHWVDRSLQATLSTTTNTAVICIRRAFCAQSVSRVTPVCHSFWLHVLAQWRLVVNRQQFTGVLRQQLQRSNKL